MRLVHDCLDAQLIDRAGVRFGRVDRLVLTIDGDGPPVVVAVEVGAVAVATRAHRRLGAALARWLRHRGAAGAKPYVVDVSRLARDGHAFRVDVDATTTSAWAFEHWVRERLVGRIPGSSS